MKNLTNKVAVITGAASGIGRSLAINLGNEGCNLAISDINEKELKKIAQMLPKNIKVQQAKLDVGNKEAFEKYAEDVIKDFGSVDIVINNAGVVATSEMEHLEYKDFEWVMQINFWGVVYGTKSFLTHLKTRPEATIVNISSINGFVPFPNSGAYNCSKYAVYGFNETLHQELADTKVNLVSVHPGGIQTNIIKNARVKEDAGIISSKKDFEEKFAKATSTSADQAAKTIIKGIKNKNKRLLVGTDAYIFDALKRIAPESFTSLVGLLAKKLAKS